MSRSRSAKLLKILLVTAGCLLLAGACSSDGDTSSSDAEAFCGVAASSAPIASGEPPEAGASITVLTHDAFAASDSVLDAYEQETGVSVKILTSSDAGTMVAQAVQTRGDPIADVIYGVDNTFLCRALQADLFVPYEAAGLEDVPDSFQLDSSHRATPINYGDVCVNHWVDAYKDRSPPGDLDDLLGEEHDSELVVQNPETSSPGFAFLLATIARYGDDWETYWAQLRDRGVAVTSGWTEAYYTEFQPYGGDRPLVVSYASSPVAEVVFADPPIDEPPTGVMEDSCFRQIEFAGVLAGTGQPAAAASFVEFMLSDTFQEDVPLNMFVFPVSSSAELPDVFAEHAEVPAAPATMSPEDIEAQRLEWTDRWVEIVLR